MDKPMGKGYGMLYGFPVEFFITAFSHQKNPLRKDLYPPTP